MICEFSIHHGNIIHGSYENKTDDNRILLVIRYARDDNIKNISYCNYLRIQNPYIKEPICKNDFDKDCINFRENYYVFNMRYILKRNL